MPRRTHGRGRPRRAISAAALLVVASVASTVVAVAPTAASDRRDAPPGATVDGIDGTGDLIAAAPGDEPCLDAFLWLSGQVCRLYRAFFLRDPDIAGMEYWISQRANRVPLETIAEMFVASDEFRAMYGSLSDDAFVDLVYQNVLGRAPDTTGKSFWLSMLGAGVSRGRVMIGFSESSEFARATGTVDPVPSVWMQTFRLYVAFFLRLPDTAGWFHWTIRLEQGMPLTQIADEFARSAEFTATYGTLTNRQFVELVYVNVLDRPGDAAGVAHWTANLDNGMLNRGALMVSFSESPEFIYLTDTTP